MKRPPYLLLLCLGCDGVQGDLLRTLPAPDMTMTPECTSGVGGGPAVCVGESELKNRAANLCTEDGLTLTSYEPSEPCGASQYRYVKYRCCPGTPQGACTTESQGGNTSCKTEREWLAAATSYCALSRLVPSKFTFQRPCSDMGTSYSYAKFLCCPPETIK